MSAKNKYKQQKKRFSISAKMYLSVTLTVIAVAVGTAVFAYNVSAAQINSYFKRLAYNSAENVASLVDSGFYARLKEVAESEDYQKVRELAEKEEDEDLVRQYLTEAGIWDDYEKNLEFLENYHAHMADIKYLYCVVFGEKDAVKDMYLIDDDEESALYYATGYMEEREKEFYGIDSSVRIEPTITHGRWGWLVSAYAPVFDEDGKVICQIGCDISMDDVMDERQHYLVIITISTLILVILALTGAWLFSSKLIVSPLNRLSAEMKKFDPGEDKNYETAHVVSMDFRYSDEIYDIYKTVKAMQIHIVDYINRLYVARQDKQKIITSLEKAESDIKDRDAQIGEISQKAYIDPLTNVGNKTAYEQKAEILTKKIKDKTAEFAVVMIDLNDLKMVNDRYGHRAGDAYIKGCCQTICMIYGTFWVYRIGGDEFAVILEGISYKERSELFEKLQNAFYESADNKAVSPQARYSASCGMAEYDPEKDESFENVFRRADNNMYENKKRFKKKHGSYR